MTTADPPADADGTMRSDVVATENHILAVCPAMRYNVEMIGSFHDKDTERVWRREPIGWLSPQLQRQARNRLLRLNAATTLQDLRQVRGNRLEKLRGDRAGQWSIRINDQYRICFRWEHNAPQEVEIIDYHR